MANFNNNPSDPWQGWPWDQRCGERPRPKDTAPARTPNGDFILYHGTSDTAAINIIKEQHIRPDGVGVVGVGPAPRFVSVYSLMKSGVNGVILKVVLDKDWVATQRVRHEIGGSGFNQFLFERPHYTRTWDGIPPAAIVGLEIVSKN